MSTTEVNALSTAALVFAQPVSLNNFPMNSFQLRQPHTVYDTRRLSLVGDSCRAAQGFTLIAVLAILVIASIIASGGMNQVFFTEKIAGDAIQRDRAFQAADGAATVAEERLEDLHKNRTNANSTASNGIFSYGSATEQWWESDTFSGALSVDSGTMLGVVAQPRYVIEEVGRYVTDGGTGIVSLDIGSAAYGRQSRSGREVVLYRVESHGKGSVNETHSVIETTFAYTY